VSHPEHDQLVFLALGEQVDAGTAEHVASCAGCAAELASLRTLVSVGGETQDLRDLPDPPEQVWDGILAQVRATEGLPAPTVRPHRTPEPVPVPVAGAAEPAPPVASLDERRRRRWPRWATTAATGLAAAAVAIAATLAVTMQREPAADVVASAPLAAYGTTPKTAHGEAQVLSDGDLRLKVADLPPVPGYYQVWLIDPQDLSMFSIGVVANGSDVLMKLPPNVDLSRYRVVDVSAEAYDNNQAHSGDSLLRGELT
jgi:anti-sigma-K factor RskA